MKPADFIDAFTAFVRENANRIAALQIVLTRPRDLTRESLRELRVALDAQHFTEPALRSAWRDKTSEDVAASIIGFVRQAALGDPLVPYAERVDRAIRAVGARHGVDDVQRRWLEQIGRELKSRIVLDRAALDEPPFAQRGGFRGLDKVFNGEIEAIPRIRRRRRLSKKSPGARGGGPRRASGPAHRALVPGRSQDRAEEQAHPEVGEARDRAAGAARPAHRLGLHLRRNLPGRGQGRRHHHAVLRHPCVRFATSE